MRKKLKSNMRYNYVLYKTSHKNVQQDYINMPRKWYKANQK